MDNREGYFQATKNKSPRDFLKKFIEKYKTGNKCTEIGSGAGNDTVYLLEQGFIVCAIDGNKSSENYILERIKNENIKNFTFKAQKLSELQLGESDIIYSAYTLPFCERIFFNKMMQNITESIKIGGFFVGNFFGENDDWKNLSLLSEHEIKSYFKDFDILEINNKEYDKGTAKDKNNVKHWHEIIIVAKKII